VHTPTPTTLEILENAAVFVDESGVIVHIDHDAISPESRLNGDLGDWSGAEVVFTQASESEFFFPGFVDTHIHASQYPNAGIFGKSTLLDWLEKYTFPLEASLANRNKARRVYGRCIARTLANGTTTAAYYATRSVDSTNLLADLCLKAGQRAFVGRCCMDMNAPDWYIDADPETAIRDTEATVAHCHKVDPERKLVCPIITPRFGPSCSSKMLHGLGKLAEKEKLPVQTHVSENKAEVKWVQELFPESQSYTDHYDTHGLLTDRTILAHAVHLTDEEIELISSRDAGVSHCPVSNLALTSGCAKIKALMKKGIKVGLGTDMSGGYSPSILEAVRQATLVSRMVALVDGDETKLSLTEALYLATSGGADVVGLGDKIGAFRVGMEWDAILVGMGNVPEEEEGEEEEEEEEEEEPTAELDFNGQTPKVDEDETAKVEDVEMKDRLPPLAHPDSVDKSAPKTGGVDNTEVRKPQIKDGVLDSAVDIFGWENWEEKVAKWVYNGDDRNTVGVWVAGVQVYRKGGIAPTWPLDRSG